LNNLPFELHVRSPSESAMRAVAAFAKKTGDFAALSMTDLKLLALTYTFEVELCGEGHIRQEPVKAVTTAIKKKEAPRKVITDDNAFTTGPGCACICGQDDDNLTMITADVITGTALATLSVPDDNEVQEVVTSGLTRDDVAEVDDDVDNDAVEFHIDGIDVEFIEEVEEDGQSEEEDGVIKADEDDAEEEEEQPTPMPTTTADEVKSNISSTAFTGIQSEIKPQQGVHVPDTRVHFTEDTLPIPSAEGTLLGEDDFPSLGSLSISSRPAVASPGNWAGVVSKTAHLSVPQRSFKNANTPLESIPMNSGATQPTGLEYFGSSSSADTTDKKEIAASYSSRILLNGGNASGQAMERYAAEDDGVGWINTSNINSFKAKGMGILSANVKERAVDVKLFEDAKVACVTTDFSMQNVLIQMNLKVMSVDGMLVRQVKQWILRCSACYRIHSDMSRMFCSKCGTNHLHRIATSIDASTGLLKLHLKRDFKVNTRGKIYPLPKPGQQGKYEGEILLREDQLLSGIWRQKVVKINRDVRSAFGSEIVSDLGLQLNKGSAIKVGLGRSNPNADKGRSKRGGTKRR
jgi:rRNA maturation endonuclease Nob1